MELELRRGGCIAEAFRLERERGGKVVWVPTAGEGEGHAYLIEEGTGATLNLGDNRFVGYENYTKDELLKLMAEGKAQILDRGV